MNSISTSHQQQGHTEIEPQFKVLSKRPGPGCSKLTTSLVNELLKFQTLISQIHQYFLLKKCEKLLHCKSFSHFFNEKFVSQGSWVRYPVWQHTFVSPSAFSRRAVVSYWRKYVHEVLVNRLGGLSLPRKSVARLTDRPDMTLDVYRGRKTTMQMQHQRKISVYLVIKS